MALGDRTRQYSGDDALGAQFCQLRGGQTNFSQHLVGVLAGIGLLWHWQQGDVSSAFEWAGLAMRWFAGLAGLAGMAWMTWQTLKIPNTQSATGILYVALVFVFLGELASAMLCYRMAVPL